MTQWRRSPRTTRTSRCRLPTLGAHFSAFRFLCSADDEGGLLPAQRGPIARRLLAAAPDERVRLLSLLHFYMATVGQDISALMEAASSRALRDAASRESTTTSVLDAGPATVELDTEDENEESEPPESVDQLHEPEEEDDNFTSMQMTLQPFGGDVPRSSPSPTLLWSLKASPRLPCNFLANSGRSLLPCCSGGLWLNVVTRSTSTS